MSVNMSDPLRAFLGSVAEAKIEANRLTFKLQRLEAQATRVTANLTGMPGGGGSDRERLLVKLADMREDAIRARLLVEQREADVAAFIDQIPDSTSRIVLKLRYCECLDWIIPTHRHRRTVMGEMEKVGLYYSERQLFRLHGKALNEAREIFKEKKDEQSRNS